jgi:hypothetical protein
MGDGEEVGGNWMLLGGDNLDRAQQRATDFFSFVLSDMLE